MSSIQSNSGGDPMSSQQQQQQQSSHSSIHFYHLTNEQYISIDQSKMNEENVYNTHI